MKLKILKLSKWDKIAVAGLVIFIIIVSIPVYTPKGECEVARPGYKCASIKDVIIENCLYWGKYNCNTSADVSLSQIEWYIKNLCELESKKGTQGIDCNNLKLTCNQVTGEQTCLVGI